MSKQISLFSVGYYTFEVDSNTRLAGVRNGLCDSNKDAHHYLHKYQNEQKIAFSLTKPEGLLTYPIKKTEADEALQGITNSNKSSPKPSQSNKSSAKNSPRIEKNQKEISPLKSEEGSPQTK